MATNRDLAMVNAAISQQNTMAKRIANMQMKSTYANNTAESLLKGAMRGGYITKDAYNQAVANIGNQTAQQTTPSTTQQTISSATQNTQQTGGITADSLMQGYQQWINQQGQQNTQQDLSSGGAAGTGYQQFSQQSGQNQQTIPSLTDSVKNMTNEDFAKQINIANMVKNQTAQTQDEQNKNVADILAKLNSDSSMADQARQLLNQRNIDYTNQTGKTDYDQAVQRTLQAAIPSLADNQAATTANAQNGVQTATQTYSNEDIAKIMADAGGGDANTLLQQLNSNPELAKQAQTMLAQRDQDYAKLQSQQTGQNSQTYTNEQIAQAISQASGRDTNEVLQQLNNNPTLVQQAQQLLTQRDRDYASLKKSETDSVAVAQSVNQPTAANTKQVSKAKSAYRQAQSATQTAKKQLDAAQKKLDQRDKKLQSLQNSLAKAKAAAKKSGHYEQVNAIQQQIRGMQDTSADNKAFQKATDAYNKARRNEQAARLKWANQAIENPVAKNGNELKVTAKPDEDQTLATAQNLVTAAQNGKLTKDQKNEAKNLANYYSDKIRKATLSGQSVSDDEMNAYTALKNATSAGASFMSGLLDAFPTTQKVASGVSNAVGKLTGEDNAGDQLKQLEQRLQTTQQITKNQHGVANVAGTMAGKGAQYALFNQLAGAAGVTPAIENALNSKLGLNAANVANTAKGVAGKKLTEQLADVIVGQAADTAFDTIPTIMDNVAAGKYNGNAKQLANDVADNQMNNLAMNMGMNTLQSGAIPSIADAIKNLLGKGKTAEDAVSNIAKNTAYTNDSNRVPLNYQSSEDATQEAQKMLSDALARQKTSVQSPEDANKEAADLLSQYMNDTRSKENVQRGVNSFVDKAKSVQYLDEQAGSIVSAAKQNQWESGMKNLERDVNNIATQNDRPIEEGVTSLASIKNTIDKMKQVRPDLSDDLDDIARRIAPENSDYLTGSVSDTAEQTAREYGNIYEGVGKSDSKATSQYRLGEYKGKAMNPDMSIASLQKNISKFEDKYGTDDKTVQTLLNKAKRAVNDIDDAVGNGKVGVAEDALDSYQSAMRDLKTYASANVKNFDPSDINARSIAGSANNIKKYQNGRAVSYADNLVESGTQDISKIPIVDETWKDEHPRKSRTMAENMSDGSMTLTQKIPTSRKTRISGTSLETMPKVSDTVEPDGFKTTHYTDSYGVVPVDDTLKKQVSGSKKIVVNDGSNFKDFVKESASNGTYNKQFLYGKVSPELSADIRNSTGKNVDNYNIALEASYVRKDFEHHGNAGQEALRGQIAITEDNFEDFVKVFDNPDSIKTITDNDIPSLDNSKREMLQFEKRIDGKEIVVTGVTDGRKTLFVDSFYETKAKADSKRVNANRNGSPSPTSENVSWVEPSTIPSIASTSKNVNNVDALNKQGADAFDTMSKEIKGEKIPSIEDYTNNGAKSAQNLAEEEINPSDAVSHMEERMGKRISKTDDEGYIGRGYTNTIKNSKLATDEQYMKGLDEQTKHFTVSEKESFENGKAAYNRDPEAFVKKYSASMEKDQLQNLGSSDIDAMHIAYGKLNQAAKDATDPVEAESLRRQASSIARNLTDAQHYNAQTLQANAKWRGTADGAIMSADGTVQRMIDESLTPRQHNQIDDASQKISEMLKNMLDGKMNTTADNQLAWQEVKKALDGYSQLKGKFTDKQIQNLTDSVLKNKDWNGMQNLLEMEMTGYSGISTDAIDKATNLFDEAQKYNYSSRKYMDLEEEAYKVLAKDIQSQPGFKGASFGKKVDSIRYLMMLGNPKTMIKNEAGNKLFGMVTEIKDNVAAVIEKAADRAIKANGDLRTKTVLNPLSKNDKGLISAAREYGEENAARALSGNKYTNSGVSLDRSISTFGNDPFGRLTQGFSDKVSDILDNADQRAMMNKYQNALARFVKANGKDASIFSDGSQEAKDFLEQASDYAVHQAEEAAFHQSDDFSNYLSKMINGLKGSDQKLARGVGTVADAVIPFKRTPANVFRSCLVYSPFEYLDAFAQTRKLVRGEISSTKYIDDIAKATTGTGMYVLGGLLANEGIIRIGSNKGTKEQNTDTRTGIQNGALYIGNHSIDLSDLAPAAYPLIAGATFQESFKNEDDFWTALTKALSSSASSLIDTTMLMGINDILESVKYGDRSESGIASVGKSVAESYAGQFFPTLGRAINSTVDDTQKSTYSSKTGLGKEVESTAKYLETKIPGLQKLGDWADKKNIPVLKNLKLQPAIDAWGNEKKQNSAGVNAYTDNKAANFAGRAVANLLTPTKVSADASLPIDNEIRKLKERLVSNGEMSAEDADDLFPYTPQSEAEIDGVKLSEKDWTQYQKDKGHLSKLLAEELLTSGKYDDLSDMDKAEILQKCYKFAKADTAKNYGGTFSSENQKLLDAYTSGGVSKVINTMISKNEKSSFESAVAASNSAGTSNINNVVDYLNALDKQDSSKAKEWAEQASEYQKGDYTKENGQWVYKNGKTTKTGTGDSVTIPGPDDVGLPKATSNQTSTAQSTTQQSSGSSNDMSAYTKAHAKKWAKYAANSTVGESGEDYSSSARYQRVSQLKNVNGVETNGIGYEKAYKEIDSDGNGSLKKSEITSWIDNMAAQNGWDQKTKRSVYTAFAPKNYKNPY